MSKYFIVIFSILVAWTNADSCITPLGKTSHCISLFDCDELLSAFTEISIPSHVTTFLRESFCGFDATGPKVCCGPLPSKPALLPNASTESPVTEPPVVTTLIPGDPIDENDANPDPKCGRDSGGDRIFGGIETGIDEYPWMALLVYLTPEGGFRYECGGALINHRYVITAAHCLIGPILEKVGTLYSVRLGEYDTATDVDCVKDDCAEPLQEIKVQAFYAHPGYTFENKDRIDDIGIIRLSQRVKYNDFVRPICLASHKSPSYNAGTDCFVAGWGKTLKGRNSPIKLKLKVPIYDKSSCSDTYQRSRLKVHLGENQLCAGGEFKKDSCTGDSGGPLMRILPGGIWEAVGLVSFGPGCGMDGWPAVYTSVAGYRNWIEEKMKEMNV